MFVGNLNYETRKEDLAEVLSSAGEIKDVYLPSDRQTGRPRGFAFVEYSSEEEAERAIEQFDGYELGGRRLRVNAAEERGRGPRPPSPDFFDSPPQGFGPDRPGRGPGKPKGSRRGMRGKKRSL